MKNFATLSEYNAGTAEERLAFDIARETKKQAYRAATAEAEAEISDRATAFRIFQAKQDAAFAATGNRDIYDLPVPSSSIHGWVHDAAVMSDYNRRAAVVAALLA
jgi:hypothetical protein